ncbi:MAG: MGMT family protein [Planctomycetota bacterium]
MLDSNRTRAPSSATDPGAVMHRIHATVDSIPRGCVATYGQVAAEALLPRRARLVGRALRELPKGSTLAWHRVVGAGGHIRVGGASASEQRRRLASEGVRVDARGRIDMKRFAWTSAESEHGTHAEKAVVPPRAKATSLLATVLAELERHGLLLQQDKQLPNVVQLVTGETLRSSWWKHPCAHDVFRVLAELAAHRDVLFTKLIGGKVTLVHRSLWPALAAVALERAPWQTRGLSAAAKRSIARVEAESSIEASGAAAKELELRLLVVSAQRHTESGEHALVLESWPTWTKRVRCKSLRDVGKARARLEAAVERLGAANASLPWHARQARR